MDSYIHRSTITNSQDMKIFINRLFYTQTHTYYSVIKKKKRIKSWHLQQHSGPGGYYTK